MQQQTVHRNNFDFLRLLLSSFVIISHSYALLGMEDQEPLKKLTGMVFSGIGVSGFFVLSGMLIYQSVVNSPGVGVFIRKRFLRIFPGLAVVVLLSTFVLGLLVTNLPLGAYLRDTATYKYLLKNIFLIPSDNLLPGVFRNNPRPEINGSLWTLRYEVLCYMGMLLFFAIPKRMHKAGALLIYGLALSGMLLLTLKPGIVSAGLAYHLDNLFTLTTYFYSGVLLALWPQVWKPYVRTIFPIALIVLALFMWLQPSWMSWASVWIYPLLLISFGSQYSPALQVGNKIGDISYGTYIYAYPIQQLLIASGVREVGWLLLWSLLCSWLAGWCSYHFIEKQFIYRKKARV